MKRIKYVKFWKYYTDWRCMKGIKSVKFCEYFTNWRSMEANMYIPSIPE